MDNLTMLCYKKLALTFTCFLKTLFEKVVKGLNLFMET